MPRRSRAADNQQQQEEEARWYTILKSILYELRPFSLPSRHDLVNFTKQTQANVKILRQEGCVLIVQLYKLLKYLATCMTWKRVASVLGFLASYRLAIWLEFGVVFLILAALVTIFTVGLSDDKREPGQLSAWSVFNQGMQTILGTVTPDQLIAEMLHQQLPGVGGGGRAIQQDHHHNNNDNNEWEVELIDAGEENADAGVGVGVGVGVGAGGGGARKSGKKARRRFDKEERRRKRDAAMAAGGGGGGFGNMDNEDDDDDFPG